MDLPIWSALLACEKVPVMGTSAGRGVHVISNKAIREFKAARPDAGPALDNGYRVSSVGKWASFAEVKQVLGSVDGVKPH